MTTGARFVGSIPEVYESHMGPVIFEPFARDLAARLPAGARRVLEVAAGTGRVTRNLVTALPADGELVATDLNEPMLAEAKRRLSDSRVTWQVADAQALPFGDGAFDAIACQFGLMFVPDRALALREMRRVLRPGGTLLLSTWNELARNPASALANQLATELMPDIPPLFRMVPFSMPDPEQLRALARDGGFSQATVETVEKVAEAPSAAWLATAFTRGTPQLGILLEHGKDVDAYEARLARILGDSFGHEPMRSPMSAHVLVAVA